MINTITMDFKTVLFLCLLCGGFSTPIDSDSASVDFGQKEGQEDYVVDKVANNKNYLTSLEDVETGNGDFQSRLYESAKAEAGDATVKENSRKLSYNAVPSDTLSKQKNLFDPDKNKYDTTDDIQVADQSSNEQQVVKFKDANEIVNTAEDYEKEADGALIKNDHERQRRDATESTEQSTDDVTVASVKELIKRTISKLNDEELSQLLNSLSEDKKQLLQTIIENDSDMKKREVVRKSGVVLESENSEGNLISQHSPDQSIANVVFSDAMQNSDSNLKASESQNSNSNEKSKREVKERDDPNIKELEKHQFNYGEILSKEYGESSELMEEEERPNPESFKVKRHLEPKYNIDELKDQGIYKQIKELEDSFPQLTAKSSIDESTKSSDTKVSPSRILKRKDSALPLKSGHEKSPGYRAENDDEDDDEGTEFEDDGFDDRTSNFASYGAGANVMNDVKNE